MPTNEHEIHRPSRSWICSRRVYVAHCRSMCDTRARRRRGPVARQLPRRCSGPYLLQAAAAIATSVAGPARWTGSSTAPTRWPSACWMTSGSLPCPSSHTGPGAVSSRSSASPTPSTAPVASLRSATWTSPRPTRSIVDLEQALSVTSECVQDALDGSWILWLLNHLYIAAQLIVVPARSSSYTGARIRTTNSCATRCGDVAARAADLRAVPVRAALPARRRRARHDHDADGAGAHPKLTTSFTQPALRRCEPARGFRGCAEGCTPPPAGAVAGSCSRGCGRRSSASPWVPPATTSSRTSRPEWRSPSPATASGALRRAGSAEARRTYCRMGIRAGVDLK